MQKKWAYIVILLFVLWAIHAKAQRPFEVLVNVQPPYPTDLNRYEEEFQNYIFTIINHTETRHEIFLTATLYNDNGVSIAFDPGYRPLLPYAIEPLETVVITGSQLLEDYGGLTTSDLQITGLNIVNTVMGALPEGNYSLCANAVHYETGTVLSTGCSFEFTPNFPGMPEIIYPLNESTISYSQDEMFNISWIPPNPDAGGLAMYEYTLKMIDITNVPMVDLEALFNTGGVPVVLEVEVSGLSYPYNGEGSDPLLIDGNTYAIRLQATDPLGTEALANQGYSEIVTFSVVNSTIVTDTLEENQDLVVPEDCETRCNVPAITDSVAVTSLAGVSNVRIGYFPIYDAQLTMTGNTFSGTGKIQLNFLNNIRVEVTLEDVMINAGGEIFGGNVRTVVNDDPAISDALEYVNLGIAENGLEALANVMPAETSAQLGNYLHESRLIGGLVGLNSVEMPIAFNESVKGNEFTIGITDINLSHEGARANIAAGIKLAMFDGPNWVMFTGREVCLHPAGFGGQYTLALGSDLVINNTDVNPNMFEVAIKGGEEGCHLSMGCAGIESLQVVGELAFPRNMLVPEMPDGTIGEDKVKATFGFEINPAGQTDSVAQGSNWMAALNFTPFQINKLEGWTFTVNTAYWDMSDLENPPAIQFPANYANVDSSFQGVYIKSAEIRAPAKMAVTDADRAAVTIENILIDPNLYMDVTATNLLNIDQGQMDSWAFALDTIHLGIWNNTLEGGHISGKIHVPVLDSATHIVYRAMIVQGETENPQPGQNPGDGKYSYDFHVTFTQDVSFPILAANATIASDSELNILFDPSNDENTNISAILRGVLTIDTDQLPDVLPDLPASVKIPGVAFSIGYSSDEGIIDEFTHISFTSPQKNISGFAISLDEFGLGSAGNNEVAATFAVSIQLSEGEEDLGGAGVQFRIISELPDLEEILAVRRAGQAVSLVKSIKLKRFVFDSIGINAHTGAVDIDGYIVFFNETNDAGVRNKYIKGEVNVVVNAGVGVEGRLMLLFGTYGTVPTTETFTFGEDFFPYWYVEGQIIISQGIPIATGIGLYGLIGGVGKNVSQQPANPALGEFGPPAFVPEYGTVQLKFGVTFGTLPSSEPFNADFIFTGVINSGGLDLITITGNGYVMAPITERESAKVTIMSDLTLLMPNATRSFSMQGFILVAVNVDPILRGNMDGGTLANQMVRADFYAGEDTWFFYMGKPEMDYEDGFDPRGSALLDLEFLQADLKGYLMVGHGIPTELPPLHPEVYEILQNPGGDYEGTSANAARQAPMPTSSGFAHGAFIAIRSDIDAYLLYANLAVYLGFDMNMTKRGTTCAQTGDLIGINGWYAEGQAYVGLRGGMGLRIKILGAEREFELFQLAAAIALAGGGPKPFYFTGRAAVSYSVLGGKIKGSSSFTMSIGERCSPLPGDPFAGINFFEEVSPSQGATDQFPGRSIRMKLALPVFEDLIIPNPTYDNNGDIVDSRDLKYEPRFTYTLRRTNNATPLACQPIYWLDENEKTQGYISPTQTLLPNTSYTLYMKVNAYDYQTNAMVQERNNSGAPIGEWKQDTTIVFTTGNLPADLYYFVNYTQPLPNQRFFTQDDQARGRINLSQILPQNHYFPSTSVGASYQYYVRFTNLDTDEASEVPFEYMVDGSNNYLNFDIPTLQNEDYYVMQVIRKSPFSQLENRGRQVTGYRKIYETNAQSQQQNTNSGNRNDQSAEGDRNGDARTEEQKITGENPATTDTKEGAPLTTLEIEEEASISPELVLQEGEFLLYHSFFRTSQYNLMRDKLAAMTQENVSWHGNDHPDYGKKVKVSYNMVEKFEERDITDFVIQAHPDVTPVNFKARLNISDRFLKPYHDNKAEAKVLALKNAATSAGFAYLWPAASLNYDWSTNNTINRLNRNRIQTSTAPQISTSEFEYLWTGVQNSSAVTASFAYNNFGNLIDINTGNAIGVNFDLIYDTHYKVAQDQKTLIDWAIGNYWNMNFMSRCLPSVTALSTTQLKVNNNGGQYDFHLMRNLSSQPNEEILDFIFGAQIKSFYTPGAEPIFLPISTTIQGRTINGN